MGRMDRRLAPREIQALRRELGVQPHELLVGGVGRLAEKKGFDTLIEAFKRANLADAKLVILGEGRERRSLERLCTERVSLPGFRVNIKDYYQAFDVFVCPSIIEPFGLVILEALDAGVPVISSDTAGPRETLERYPGTLVPAGDVEALACQLRAHASGARVKEPHDLSAYALRRVADLTEAAYRELIAECRPGEPAGDRLRSHRQDGARAHADH